jgi:hypothetical protein
LAVSAYRQSAQLRALTFGAQSKFSREATRMAEKISTQYEATMKHSKKKGKK